MRALSNFLVIITPASLSNSGCSDDVETEREPATPVADEDFLAELVSVIEAARATGGDR